MKKLSIRMICMVLCLCCVFMAGCSMLGSKDEDKKEESSSSAKNDKEDNEDEESKDADSEPAEEPEETAEPEETEVPEEVPAEPVTPDVEETPEESGATATPDEVTPEAPKSATSLSDAWINLDEIQFAVNGKVYTLGKTTLQEMIDDGVPFEEDDLANAGNNLNGNSQSQKFKIVLGEYYSAYVYTANYTDENAKIADCIISEFYFPVNAEKEQDILTLTFPLDMTEEALLENAGEPTEVYNWESDDSDAYSNKYSYTRESTKYYGDWGYVFEFMNGDFDYVTIDWMP